VRRQRRRERAREREEGRGSDTSFLTWTLYSWPVLSQFFQLRADSFSHSRFID